MSKTIKLIDVGTSTSKQGNQSQIYKGEQNFNVAFTNTPTVFLSVGYPNSGYAITYSPTHVSDTSFSWLVKFDSAFNTAGFFNVSWFAIDYSS
jgi:hypothetical protein